ALSSCASAAFAVSTTRTAADIARLIPLILSSPRRIVIRVRVGRRACPRDSRSPRGRPSGHYAGQSIKIVDVHSGAIVRELTYKHFGPTSEVLLSRQTGTLATVNAWLGEVHRKIGPISRSLSNS